MKYIDEFRDNRLVQTIAADIKRITTRPWAIMEVCGGQTHAIMRYGIEQLLPDNIELLHGPGCPVCVTPQDTIDAALAVAAEPSVIFCSFGDMLRVPGSDMADLHSVRARGGDVRIVYSPLDAVETARRNPDREVVFFAVGFETTAPANALAACIAKKENLKNFSLLVSQVLVPPAVTAILEHPDNRVQGFLAAGHVCSVMGYREYEPIALRYRTPIVVTGFEPIDLLSGILGCVRQLENGRYEVENQYARSVTPNGNRGARDIITEVFEITNKEWRGLGEIPHSGLGFRDSYRELDAAIKFAGVIRKAQSQRIPPLLSPCISGEILTGHRKPNECPSFNTTCNPENPLGATMVSSEGACAAYYRYRRG